MEEIALQYEEERIYGCDENGEVILEITFPYVNHRVNVINHTYVSEVLRGQGLASKLVKKALAEIKRQNHHYLATCPYVVPWLKRHQMPVTDDEGLLFELTLKELLEQSDVQNKKEGLALIAYARCADTSALTSQEDLIALLFACLHVFKESESKEAFEEFISELYLSKEITQKIFELLEEKEETLSRLFQTVKSL